MGCPCFEAFEWEIAMANNSELVQRLRALSMKLASLETVVGRCVREVDVLLELAARIDDDLPATNHPPAQFRIGRFVVDGATLAVYWLLTGKPIGKDIEMNNLFMKLGSSFSTEDFFTACVALFVERNSSFREMFLKWLEEATGESFRGFAWRVEIQSASSSCAGAAVLDMKLRHPSIELWFEHKVDASLGCRRTPDGKEIDQIEKYLDAAARLISGITVGDQAVEWPVSGPVADQPRVLLFYISRSGQSLDRNRYEGKLYEPGGFGFEPFWDGLKALATETLEWSYKQGYLGNWISFTLSTGVADQVGIQAWASRDEMKVDSSGLENETIELQIRLRDASLPLPAPGEKLAFERWRGVTGLGVTKGRNFLRIHVGVADWKSAHTQEPRTRAVTGAFIAGLKMFEQATRHTLPGLERI